MDVNPNENKAIVVGSTKPQEPSWAMSSSARHRAYEVTLLDLSGQGSQPPVTLHYRLAAMVAALVMILLPTVYGLLILSLVWLLVDYVLGHIVLLLAGEPPAQVMLFLLPALLLMVMLAFMLKPMLTKLPPEQAGCLVTREKEPMLYGLVDQIARHLGAPMPDEIHLSLGVEAGVRTHWTFIPGRGKSVLLIGLTLLGGLRLGEVSSVIAHELGHFAQRQTLWSMRVIAAVNGWLVRGVYLRDSFDEKLNNLQRRSLSVLAYPFIAIGWIVALGRGLLWVLMRGGQMAHCYVSRQMEYNADQVSARVGGPGVVASALRRTRMLDLGVNAANNDIGEAWRSRRLPDNIPALVIARIDALDPKEKGKIDADLDRVPTHWYDTHPTVVERIAAVSSVKDTRHIRSDAPGSVLIHDYEQRCRQATSDLYRERLKDRLDEGSLVSVAELMRDIHRTGEAFEAQWRVLQLPLLLAFPPKIRVPDLSARDAEPANPDLPTDLDAVKQSLVELRKAILLKSEKRDTLLSQAMNLREQLTLIAQVQTWIAAGRRITAKEAGLTTVDEYNLRVAAQELSQAIAENQAKAEGMLKPISERLNLALTLTRNPQIHAALASQGVDDATLDRWTQLLKVVEHIEAARLDALRAQELIGNIMPLAQSVDPAKIPSGVSRVLAARLPSIQAAITRVSELLGETVYPFEHGRGRVSMAHYLTGTVRQEPSLADQLFSYAAAYERYVGLFERTVAHLCEATEKIELALGLEPMQDPRERWAKDAEQNQPTAPAPQGYRIGWRGHLAASVAVICTILLIGVGGAMTGKSAAVHVPRHVSYTPVIVPERVYVPNPGTTWNSPTHPASPYNTRRFDMQRTRQQQPIQPRVPGTNLNPRFNPSNPNNRSMPHQSPYSPPRPNHPNQIRTPSYPNSQYGPRTPSNRGGIYGPHMGPGPTGGAATPGSGPGGGGGGGGPGGPR